MQTITQATRGLKVNFSVPSTTEEFDTIVGNGAALAAALQQTVYRALLPRAWREFFSKAEEKFAVARPTTTVKAADGTDEEVGVPDDKYLKAIEASTSPAERQEFLQSIIDAWTGFEVTTGSRSKKPAALFYAKAKEVIAKILASGAIDDAIARFTTNSASRGASTPLVIDEETSLPTEDTVAARLEEVAKNEDLF